ncbi:Predicted secreted protein [Pseudoalteromonas luteoviolacea B = ATCC 29581]|nr:Predicted secreted protein [Pseudoalteromonas luteoviolacea B = ATCC 29581]
MKNLLFSAFLLVLSTSSYADFEAPGKGVALLMGGVEKPFEFGFEWFAPEDKFTIGKKAYNMDLPESYSIAMTLDKEEEQVWIQEFHKGFITGFNWEVGPHKLSLRKEVFAQRVKGDFILNVDGIDYFLLLNNVSIDFHFKNDGIDMIKLEGVTKDRGTRH